MGSGGSRRIVGVVVLAGALVLAFLVARGASFPQAGHPLAAWPPPPPVDTCQELQGGALHTVPCNEPHGMEITKTWRAIDTVPTDLATACSDAADVYLGAAANPKTVDGWHPDAPHYSGYQWTAPSEDVVGGRGWTVCVIAPWRPTDYTGSVHDLASPADRPAAYGVCGVSGAPTLLSCDQPHGWEQLGQATVDLGAAAGDQGMARVVAAYQDSCRTLAASMIGVADPTYGDRLRIVVDASPGYSITISDRRAGSASTTPTRESPTTGSTATSPLTATLHPPATPVAVLTCQVLDAHEQLMGSVMGLGDRPLPVK